MARRSIEDWQALVVEQEKSGLTIAAFCRSQGLNTKYFYLRRKRLSRETDSAFIPVQMPQPKTQPILVEYQDISIIVPPTFSAGWVAELVQGLRT